MTINQMTEAISKAIRRHQQSCEHYVVCEIDEGEGRRIMVVPESYTHGDEFEAFDGVVLYTTEEE